MELSHVTFRYGEKLILDDFSMCLPEAGVSCVTAPSGSGKTTLLRLLIGLLRPESGRVTGLAPGEAGVLFQEDRLLPWRTALENIAVLPGMDSDRARLWLEKMELGGEAGRYPAELSGGMRRRVALARALAYGGRLLVLDEPFTGMDDALKERLFPLIREAGIPALVVTHEAEEIRRLADAVYTFSGPPLRRAE